MIKPDTITDMDQLGFSEHVDHLLKWLKKYWNLGRPAPKGYQKFRKNYEDFAGMTPENEKEATENFDGLDDATAGSFCFPIKMSLPHIAYDDVGQGRRPLRMLIAGIFSYGIGYGQKVEAISTSSDTHFRINHLSHCMSMATMSEDVGIKLTYDFEHRETAEPGSDWIKIGSKWDKIRKEVKKIHWHKLSEKKKDKLWNEVVKRKKSYEEFKSRKAYKGNIDSEYGDYIFMKFYEPAD